MKKRFFVNPGCFRKWKSATVIMTADIRPPPKRQKQVKSKNCTTKTPAVPVIMRKPDFNFLGQKGTKIWFKGNILWVGSFPCGRWFKRTSQLLNWSVFSERKYSVRDDSLIGQDMHSIHMPAMPIKQAFCEKWEKEKNWVFSTKRLKQGLKVR